MIESEQGLVVASCRSTAPGTFAAPNSNKRTEHPVAKGDQRSNKMVKKPKKDTSPPPNPSSSSDRPMPPVTTVMPKGKMKNK
jgi:hypothetical protein